MMSYWFLALLLALVENTWGLPMVLNKAMKVLAESDIDLTKFFKSMDQGDFKALPELYTNLAQAGPKLKAAQDQLSKTPVDRSVKPLKRMVDIQLDTVMFNIMGVISPNEGLAAPKTELSDKPSPASEVQHPTGGNEAAEDESNDANPSQINKSGKKKHKNTKW